MSAEPNRQGRVCDASGEWDENEEAVLRIWPDLAVRDGQVGKDASKTNPEIAARLTKLAREWYMPRCRPKPTRTA
jgi:hypothetical protein